MIEKVLVSQKLRNNVRAVPKKKKRLIPKHVKAVKKTISITPLNWMLLEAMAAAEGTTVSAWIAREAVDYLSGCQHPSRVLHSENALKKLWAMGDFQEVRKRIKAFQDSYAESMIQ